MGATYDITGLTDAIDWTSPDSVDDQGNRLFSVRCRLPFSVPMVGGAVATDHWAQRIGSDFFGETPQDTIIKLEQYLQRRTVS